MNTEGKRYLSLTGLVHDDLKEVRVNVDVRRIVVPLAEIDVLVRQTLPTVDLSHDWK